MEPSLDGFGGGGGPVGSTLSPDLNRVSRILLGASWTDLCIFSPGRDSPSYSPTSTLLLFFGVAAAAGDKVTPSTRI